MGVPTGVRGGALLLAAAAVLTWPSAASAQLAETVAGVDDGVVRFAYDLKPGVEVCDRGIRSGGHRVTWRSDGRYDPGVCVSDVVELELEVRAGTVRDLEVVKPSDPEPVPLARDVGLVPASEAVDFLLGLSRSGATVAAAEDAVFPATLADVDGTWRELLALAQDRAVDREVRKASLFWVGQEAADAVTEGLSGVALADDEEQEVREAAIFALSQRPENQAVASLIEIARSAEQAESRRTAMFWLAQSEDDRVVAFFEEVLLGRNR
ncbi:MAG: HEAT repeat domain-containing protein [Longimicrobiales bacterium]|nr:HEAT repeat domain-containing protein [Longimicrobiales bacterium]